MNNDLMQKIEELLIELITLKGILPGSISKQYNVCGTPRCKCKDPENPVKHGPYYQLSYTVLGKSSSMHLNVEDIGRVENLQRNYKRFKEICRDIPGLFIQLYKTEGFNDVELTIVNEELINEKRNNREQVIELENKLTGARKKLHRDSTTIYDLSVSRDKWKDKATAVKLETKAMKNEITKLNRKLKHQEFEIEKLNELKKKRKSRGLETV